MSKMEKFQFQTGSIKSSVGMDDMTLNESSFNSKLVRLKVFRYTNANVTQAVSIPNWFD